MGDQSFIGNTDCPVQMARFIIGLFPDVDDDLILLITHKAEGFLHCEPLINLPFTGPF